MKPMADGGFERYSRHVLFQGLGEAGQRRILGSTAAIVGCGALGSAQAEMLVRAGVGELRVIDRDFVDWSNLQRQSLFTEEDAAGAVPKAVALARELRRINSGCRIAADVADFNTSTAEDFLAGCCVALDGSDNFQARYLLNDCAVKLNIPWVYGACVGSYGAVAPFLPGETPCLRCLFPESPSAGEGPTCDTAGIITPLPRHVASLQATEALKILSGCPDRVHRAFVSLDLWENRSHRMAYGLPEPLCRCCGKRRFDFLEGTLETEATALCGRNAVQILPGRRQRLDLALLGKRMAPAGPVTISDHLVKLDLPDYELAVFADGRAIVRGTTDPSAAKTLYARYVGE
jgi:molybdopterin/thiamine biosynthesis adenylyltransferase